MRYVNEKNTHYTAELRHADGHFTTQVELKPIVYHHATRDLAILELLGNFPYNPNSSTTVEAKESSNDVEAKTVVLLQDLGLQIFNQNLLQESKNKGKLEEKEEVCIHLLNNNDKL